MKVLFILNDPPYGTERSYNALRLANALAKNEASMEVTLFLQADAVTCAKKGQKTPDGYYNLERMIRRFTTGVHKLLLCGHTPNNCLSIDVNTDTIVPNEGINTGMLQHDVL